MLPNCMAHLIREITLSNITLLKTVNGYEF